MQYCHRVDDVEPAQVVPRIQKVGSEEPHTLDSRSTKLLSWKPGQSLRTQIHRYMFPRASSQIQRENIPDPLHPGREPGGSTTGQQGQVRIPQASLDGVRRKRQRKTPGRRNRLQRLVAPLLTLVPRSRSHFVIDFLPRVDGEHLLGLAVAWFWISRREGPRRWRSGVEYSPNVTDVRARGFLGHQSSAAVAGRASLLWESRAAVRQLQCLSGF